MFFETETGSSIFPEKSNIPRQPKRLVSCALDKIAAELSAPIMLKIDVQRAEPEVLKGGEDIATLRVYEFDVAAHPTNAGAATMLEVLHFMNGTRAPALRCFGRDAAKRGGSRAGRPAVRAAGLVAAQELSLNFPSKANRVHNDVRR